MLYVSSNPHYNFSAELADALERTRRREKARAEYCQRSEAEYARRFTAGDFAAGKPEGKVRTAPPSAEHFHRHRERFGGSLVADTAKQLGISLRRESADRHRPIQPLRHLSPRRRTTPEMRRQVLELLAQGVRPAAVAGILNISRSRVSVIASESPHSSMGSPAQNRQDDQEAA